MDFTKLLKMISLSDNPEWATRSPDKQVAVDPTAPAPLKQGGMPTPASATAPEKPKQLNPAQLGKAADSLLLGDSSQQGAANPSGTPGQETSGNTSLSQALRMRKLARQGSESMPNIGSIGYKSTTGGY